MKAAQYAIISRMKTVYKGGSAEIIEKKSRFIADVAPVKSEEEAAAFIAEVKKRYWDCRHNCSAFVIGENGQLSRCSDDGEPSGTAGRPILDVITGSGLTDICIVVSRYFGGTLLGTGGLVRAYSGAARAGIEASEIMEVYPGRELYIASTYDFVGKIQFAASELGIHETCCEYGEGAAFSYMVRADLVDKAILRLTDITAGKAQITLGDEIKYAIIDGRVLKL